jgi:3-hydroxyisobutyrate dehydrogenase-like beta-hydroxyacid dehydrogenase
MKVSFIGLGKMGQAMADRIIGGGHELGVYNRTASKAADLVKKGAKQMASPAEAAGYSDVVITMLENDNALAEVVYGEGGLIKSMAKGAIHLCMGTHGTGNIRKLTQAHADAGQILVSAPVLGRPPAAAAGQLGIITGGPAAAVEKCQPIFAAMGRRTFDGGSEPVGAAAAKIANNFVLAAAIEAMGEGFALAEKCGVPSAGFLDILTDGLFSAPAYKVYGNIIAKELYDQVGFTTALGLKDTNLMIAAGLAENIPLPSLNVYRDKLLAAMANGDANKDWSVVARHQARSAGLDK